MRRLAHQHRALGRKAIGAKIALQSTDLSAEATVFGESPSRIVVSFSAENLDRVKSLVSDCPFSVIGEVGGNDLKVTLNSETVISSPISELEAAWRDSLRSLLEN